MTYYCSECLKECQPELCNAGIQSGCHEETPVMVIDQDAAWVKPEDVPLRLLTADEESELNEELWRELRAEESPGQRAQRNWREGS